MFTSSKQSRKRKFNVVFAQVEKKSPLLVIYLLGSFRLTLSLLSPSPSPSSLLRGFIDVRKESEHVFRKKACHLFTRYICYWRFGPLMNYFVSLETDIWVENKKKSIVLEKYIYIFQRNNQRWMNWGKLCSWNNHLKIFCFLFRITLFLVIHFISLLCTTFSGTYVRTVRQGSYAPASEVGSRKTLLGFRMFQAPRK